MRGHDPVYKQRARSEVPSKNRCSVLREHERNSLVLMSEARALRANCRSRGGVAQLGEHLPCKQGVKGSIPFISTRERQSEGKPKKQSSRHPSCRTERKSAAHRPETGRGHGPPRGLIAQVVRARA